MFKTLKNAFSLPELRRKMLYVVFIVILYRIGATIPVPYVSSDAMSYMLSLSDGSIFQYMSILSGTAFSRATLFALSISPYINASIIMQLLCTAIPALENMAKEEDGRKKVSQITRYVTVGLALITAYGYYTTMRNMGVLTNDGVFAAIVIIACYTAGSCLIMWLGEKINEHGIGNGISIILFTNIVSSIPTLIGTLISYFASGIGGVVIALLTIIIALAMVVFIVFMNNSERRLPVQYAKRVVGRKMYGGQSSTLPLKLNMSGVMPVIFANSILALPSTIGMIANPKEGGFWAGFINLFSYTSWLYVIIFLVRIIFFAYFYIAISFNPIEVANNLKKNGGFIPGIRPGKPTADYITKVLNKVTLMGAFFLSVIAVLPLAANIISGNQLSGVAFAGTSIIIVVGVAVETAREIEAQMTMRHYKGFLE
ncbi:MAG: preprotein translocase subunit SecY [Clostridia bacterium]|nr:preprotein translocase subunit SecY [Clostridia bacterium]